VDGCIYDVIRKPSLKPYKATELKYKKDGALYANCREFDETPDEYEARIATDISENPDAYFRRVEVPRLDAEMADYLSDMWAVGREIADAQQYGRWPKNPRSCDNYGNCPYFDVCAGTESIDNPHRFVTTNQNPELETA